MNEENFVSEFNEKFATVEDSLKYIAASQAESETLRKRDQLEHRKRMTEIETNLQIITQDRFKSHQRTARIEKRIEQDQIEHRERMAEIERHLAHITKFLRFNIDAYEFHEDKLEKAGKILQKKKS